jgi:hypothetical protein
LFVPANGRNYVFDFPTNSWVSRTPLDPLVLDSQICSVATVRNLSYIFYPTYGAYVYNSDANIFELQTLFGIDATLAKGICASNGYLIAWDKKSIYWSSPADPLDFQPTNRTGAGGGTLQEANGEINFCVSVSDGFIIFCDKNAVGASYTGNTDYPFLFKEIKGSGGARYPNDMASQGNFSYFPGMTTAGIQQVSINNAIPTMPEVSDFLTLGLYEDFDDDTNSFVEQAVGIPLYLRFQSVANKYIVISYGTQPNEYTYAILYDMTLNRYGKVKIKHRNAMMFVFPNPTGAFITYAQLINTPANTLGTTKYSDLYYGNTNVDVQPKQNIGFMQEDGTVYILDFNVMNPASDGTFIIGRYQHVRAATIYHQTTEIETIRFQDNFQMLVLPTLNGKDFLPAIPAVTTKAGATMLMKSKRVNGKNISLLLKGPFNLTTMVIRYTLGGWR